MRQVKNRGNLPPPLQGAGLFSEQMHRRVWSKVGTPEIWECSGVDELGRLGHLDECEFQPLIDMSRGRYYLVAISADPERTKTKIDTTEEGEEVIDIDKSSKPVTVVYYTEITEGQCRRWQREDYAKRRHMIIEESRLKAALREAELNVPMESITAN